MVNISTLISLLLKKNPNVANIQKNKDMLSVIQNGDQKTGEQIAENLCRTYGVTKEEAIEMAKAFFHI